jgi:hypothetical protein
MPVVEQAGFDTSTGFAIGSNLRYADYIKLANAAILWVVPKF